MTYDRTGMFDLEPVDGCVTIGNGKEIKITHRGKIKVTIEQKNGGSVTTTLTNVKLVPELSHHLFSLSSILLKGWKLSSGWSKDGSNLEIAFESR